MMKKRYFLAFITILLFILPSTFGQTGIPKAQSMFIYNFSRLIEWPAAYKSGEFIITVVGNSSVANELEAFTAGKKVGTQSIKIERVKEPEEIQRSHIVFVSYGKSNKMVETMAATNGTSTLIIGEKRGLLDEGAAVNFIIVGDKLKFELNKDNASSKGLQVSTALINMAD